MFGLFRTEDFHHPSLGTLQRSRGYWRGQISFPGVGTVPLIIDGTRKGPDSHALQHAINLPLDFAHIAPQLKQALYEHYEPYAEATTKGHLAAPREPLPQVSCPEDTLRLIELEAVAIIELDGELATEMCFYVPWDEEHMLGARFRGGQWIELCGSTLVP